MHNALLARQFRVGPKEFRPVPFWFWNGDPTTKTGIRAQLREMKARGAGGVMPMALYGLDLEFAGEDYGRMIRYTAEVCRDLGLTLWLYDEFHCPSGTCAGKVLRDHPEFNRRAVVCNTFELRPGGRLSVRLRFSAQRYPDPDPGREVFADSVVGLWALSGGVCRPATDYRIVEKDIAPKGRAHFLEWAWRGRAPARVYLLTMATGNTLTPAVIGTKWALFQPGYIDVLDPKAVSAFLHAAFDGLERHVGEFFGNVIPGVFTDEPSIPNGIYGGGSSNWPYTATLCRQFRERYGYDLSAHWIELVADTGDYRRVRADYWRLVTELFARHFNRQYHDWCARRGLIFGGHYMAEQNLRTSAMMSGDIYECAKWMHAPGIDILGTRTSYGEPLALDESSARAASTDNAAAMIVTPRLLVSAAHAQGAPRVMCEAFGVPRWGVTLQDLKNMTDWLCALGVNWIVDNGMPYSLRGFRMMAGRSFLSPWWPHYGALADYAARLSLIHSAGRTAAEIAVYYPTTAAWCSLNHKQPAPEAQAMQECVYQVNRTLLLDHREFDFLFEGVLRQAKVRDAALCVRDYRYRLVIIPAVTVLPAEALAALRRFLRGGGRLIVVGAPPRTAMGPGGETSIPAAFWQHRHVARVAEIASARGQQALNRAVAAAAPGIFRIEGRRPERVQFAHRLIGGAHFVFLVNHDRETNPIALSARLSGSVAQWHLETGRVTPLRHIVRTAAEQRLSLALRPYESVLLAFRKGAAPAMAPVMVKDIAVRDLPLAGAWDFRPENANLLRLEARIAFDVAGRGLAEQWGQGGAEARWESLRDGQARLPLSPQLMRAFWLRADVTLAALPARPGLYFDSQTPCRLWVNGQEAGPAAQRALWAGDNVYFDLRGKLRRGRNRLVLRVEPSPYADPRIIRENTKFLKAAYPAAPVLAGDFLVTGRQAVTAWKLPIRLNTGSWHTQGFPYFAGRAEYAQTFSLPGGVKRAWLDLGALRDTVEVSVNGRPAAVRAWSPYVADISALVRPGENRLAVTVCNTFGNVIKPHYFGWNKTVYPAGLLGPCVVRYEEG